MRHGPVIRWAGCLMVAAVVALCPNPAESGASTRAVGARGARCGVHWGPWKTYRMVDYGGRRRMLRSGRPCGPYQKRVVWWHPG
jgi:hypothetical protein